MASLGIPLEERQKAYAGYTTDDLMAKYNEARLKGDLPSMFALLDIIKAAPKPLKTPKTTVEDDIIAAAQSQMPQPAPTGMQGALTAMENQNEMAPVMAADGGFMGRGDNDPVEMLSKGGIARFQFGGAGTVAPYSSFSALSFADVERMAMMGDPDAQKELSNRMRANVRPAPVPGPGPSITTQQVTDQFGPRGKIPGPVAATPTPAASAARPGIGSILSKIPGAGLISRHPYISGAVTAATLGQPLVDRLMATDRGTPSEELDAIAAMQGTQGGIDRSAAGQTRFTPPAARDPGAPAAPPAAPPGAPPPSGVGKPGLPFNLADFKPKSIDDYIRERNQYEATLGAEQGVRSLQDIKQDLAKFSTRAKERSEADRKAAQETFKDDLLMSAALVAPQFLKGRGLAQATARAAETFSPMATKAMGTRAASIKDAIKTERDAQDKFELAQLDLDKAYRAEELGKFDKAASLRDSSMKIYVDAALKKYSADTSYAATLGYVDRIVAKGLIDAAGERVKALQLNPEFRKLDIPTQQRLINSILQGAVNSEGGGRPRIVDVPGT